MTRLMWASMVGGVLAALAHAQSDGPRHVRFRFADSQQYREVRDVDIRPPMLARLAFLPNEQPPPGVSKAFWSRDGVIGLELVLTNVDMDPCQPAQLAVKSDADFVLRLSASNAFERTARPQSALLYPLLFPDGKAAPTHLWWNGTAGAAQKQLFPDRGIALTERCGYGACKGSTQIVPKGAEQIPPAQVVWQDKTVSWTLSHVAAKNQIYMVSTHFLNLNEFVTLAPSDSGMVTARFKFGDRKIAAEGALEVKLCEQTVKVNPQAATSIR